MSSTNVFGDGVCFVFYPVAAAVVDYLGMPSIMFENYIALSLNQLYIRYPYIICSGPEQKGLGGHTLIEHHDVVSEEINNNNDFILYRRTIFSLKVLVKIDSFRPQRALL